ncbi:MAG: endo alpha-1,4 polygalactosaminidase [Desulfovibrio sp.]|nr:endo alpha-1,4 polygalactosaminidase [Desulfovibrio sp.]
MAMALSFLLAASSCWAAGLPRVDSWACFYGSKDNPSLTRFDLVVLESGHLAPPAKKSGKPISLGYISLGEVDMDGRYWDSLKSETFLQGKSEAWNSKLVDIRAPQWRAFVLERLVTDVLARGYDGVFLDTLDSSLYLEDQKPDEFSGMRQAALDLVGAIRDRFPEIPICINRAAPLWQELAPKVQFVLAECLYGDYDFKKKRFVLTSKPDRAQLLAAAAMARKANPELTLLSLDYISPKDHSGIRAATAFSRKHGFIPYVSTPKLDTVSTRALTH